MEALKTEFRKEEALLVLEASGVQAYLGIGEEDKIELFEREIRLRSFFPKNIKIEDETFSPAQVLKACAPTRYQDFYTMWEEHLLPKTLVKIECRDGVVYALGGEERFADRDIPILAQKEHIYKVLKQAWGNVSQMYQRTKRQGAEKLRSQIENEKDAML